MSAPVGRAARLVTGLCGLCTAGLFTFAATVAAAGPAEDLVTQRTQAMENYDLAEYEAAKKQLIGALALAKKHKLENSSQAAQLHLALGVVSFVGMGDPEAAREAFAAALAIDAKLQLDVAYRTDEMAALLDDVRSEVGGGGGGGGGGSETTDCEAIEGLRHEIIETAPAGQPRTVEAWLGASVAAEKVSVFYRPEGQMEFVEVVMEKKDGCRYAGELPAAAMRGATVHYYIAALGAGDDDLAHRGTEGSPNLIEISNGSDGENPFGEQPEKPSTPRDGGKARVYLSVAVGSGGAYVTGKTELQQTSVECCIAPSMFHVSPEFGLFVTPNLAIGLAGRIGFPIGANVEGHSTLAPAGLLRLRYSTRPGGYGLGFSGSAGGGFIRNPIKLRMFENEMDTDIVTLGPLLIGAGAGYQAGLGGTLRFVADFQMLAGIPIMADLNGSPLNFGVQFDASLGFAAGF